MLQRTEDVNSYYAATISGGGSTNMPTSPMHSAANRYDILNTHLNTLISIKFLLRVPWNKDKMWTALWIQGLSSNSFPSDEVDGGKRVIARNM